MEAHAILRRVSANARASFMGASASFSPVPGSMPILQRPTATATDGAIQRPVTIAIAFPTGAAATVRRQRAPIRCSRARLPTAHACLTMTSCSVTVRMGFRSPRVPRSAPYVLMEERATYRPAYASVRASFSARTARSTRALDTMRSRACPTATAEALAMLEPVTRASALTTGPGRRARHPRAPTRSTDAIHPTALASPMATRRSATATACMPDSNARRSSLSTSARRALMEARAKHPTRHALAQKTILALCVSSLPV